MKMSLCKTPTKVNKILRRNGIREAILFAYDIVVLQYDIPYNLYFVNGMCSLYHEIRVKDLRGFTRMNIQPFKIETEFSHLPAFHVANDIRIAFEFPLHNHLHRWIQGIQLLPCNLKCL